MSRQRNHLRRNVAQGPDCRTLTPAVFGKPTESLEHFRPERRKDLVWIADLIAPKCAVPVSIWQSGWGTTHAVTPDTTLALCSGYWGESFWGDFPGVSYTFIRQHMSGVHAAQDLRKSLGAITYLGGALAAPIIKGDAGIYSDRGRSTSADKTWAGLHKAGLAEEIEGEPDSNIDCNDFSLTLDDLAYISGWGEDDVWDESPALNKPVKICQLLGSDSGMYDVILADTVLESGLVLAVNIEELLHHQRSLFTQRRPTPQLLVSLDLSFTPFESIRDWLHLLTAEDPWNTPIETDAHLGVPRTESGEAYLQAIEQALPQSTRPEFIPVWRDALASFSQMSLVSQPWNDRGSPMHQSVLREAAARIQEERNAEANRLGAYHPEFDFMYSGSRPNRRRNAEPSRFLPPDAESTARITSALAEVD